MSIKQAIEALEIGLEFTEEACAKKSAKTIRAALAALRSMPAEPPYAYIHEWDGPFGVHQSTSSARYNGMAPHRSVPVWTTPPPAPVLSDAEPVAWCALTGNGQIAYFDGRPIVMTGPVGNEHHPVPLFPFATPPPAPVLSDSEVLRLRSEHGWSKETIRAIERAVLGRGGEKL